MLEIYNPEQDSFLLSKVLLKQIPKLLKKNKNLTFLEIGCGSGIQLQTALELGIKKQNIFSCDINPKAVKHCKKLRFHCVKSDLFEKIGDRGYQSEAMKRYLPSTLRGRSEVIELREKSRNRQRQLGGRVGRKIKGFPRKYNLIIFNPPYLPEDKREPKNSCLATTGGKKGNEIILRFLKQAKKYLEEDGKIFLITSSLSEKIDFEKLGYKEKEIGCEKLFFERLCVWEIKLFK
ncbi:methyltransferase domain-containing protein [Candidatus Pacearchaeota archaeon]|nr:methyltransferase domain-containing protein [Candidatus Pacearchaeota archaeon]